MTAFRYSAALILFLIHMVNEQGIIDELAWESLDGLVKKHPELGSDLDRNYFNRTGLLNTSDAATVLLKKGARADAEQLAVILDEMGQGFKARIIRENVLGQKKQ